MRSFLKVYLFVSVIVMVAYLFTEGETWLQTAVRVGVGWTSAGCIVFGVRRNRPDAAAAWYWFAAGIFANATGSLVEAIRDRFVPDGFQYLPDIFWLGFYPCLFIGLATLIVRRTTNRDWASVVDAGTISTGLGLLSWVFVIHPATTENLPLIEQAIVVAYPVGDLVVLGMIVRLVLGVGNRNPSFRSMLGSLLVFLVGDVGWVIVSHSDFVPSTLLVNCLDVVFLLAYVLFAVAALHPSMRTVEEKFAPVPPRLSPALLTLLTLAALIAPAILMAQVAANKVTDGVAIAVSSTTLFLLVITRMAQLFRKVEAQTGELKELAHIDELTGLPNRRGWNVDLAAALGQARRSGGLLTVAMLDLDHFKVFNDEFGHPAGDRLLKGAGAAWREQLRGGDLLARYGGEEFILLCPGADAQTASDVLGRLRAVTPDRQAFSGGIAVWDGAETSDQLVARADAALYAAKEGGRDRWVTSPTASEGVGQFV